MCVVNYMNKLKVYWGLKWYIEDLNMCIGYVVIEIIYNNLF